MTEQYSSLSAFLSRQARLVFLDVIFSTWIFFSKVIQKLVCYWVLAQVCTSPMLRKSEKIMMSWIGKHNSYPKVTKKRVTPRKWQQHVWVRCL